MQPDLVVIFGARSILSLVGIALLVAGVWHVDRTWDEEGSKAYEQAASGTGSTTSKEGTSLLNAVTISQEALDAAFPFPWAFLLGWFLYGAAYLFSVNGGNGIAFTSWAVMGFLASLALGVIASVPMGEAVKNRDSEKKTKLGMMFVFTWLILTVATIAGNSGPCLLYCPLGAISIVASMKILWKHRKMGDSWEQEGKPNPNPVVYNMGGPLFVLGWFIFWVGMAGTTKAPADSFFLPIYYNLRTIIAFLSGCGMVPVVMMLDYAHDEGAEFVGFGTDGRYFGRFAETPIPFILAWTFFGAASLLPFDGVGNVSTRQWTILLTCILQGIDAGVLIQTALYKGDLAAKKRWSVPFVLLFAALAINIGIHGGLALALALPGAVLIILGQKTVFGNRKRGDYWMEHQQVNPNPIVYSAGEPIFMAGWIIISLAMSLPM